MTLFQQSMLAIVQAILEWLPVSSEGFLVIVGENVFGINALEAFRKTEAGAIRQTEAGAIRMVS